MRLRNWWRLVRTVVALNVLACRPAQAPDYNHQFRRFVIYVDNALPLKWIKKGADDWTRVTGDVFTLVPTEHEKAMVLSLSTWSSDILVMVDASELDGAICEPSNLACFTRSTVYMFPDRIMKDHPSHPYLGSRYYGAGANNGTWSQVPAHEIGHFLGLDHIETRPSVMGPNTGVSTEAPTEEDGALVIQKRLHPPKVAQRVIVVSQP
jgi:hypothetical protein